MNYPISNEQTYEENPVIVKDNDTADWIGSIIEPTQSLTDIKIKNDAETNTCKEIDFTKIRYFII